MSGLQAYHDSRLELGDMLRAALYLARASGDEEAERRARDLLARLAADRFQLAIVGQFSRGKTTLMNALLGGPYLPMGARPMTSVITTVRYGSRPRAMVRRRGSGLRVEVPLSEVAKFVGSSGAERAELQVVAVDVEVPAEILRLGFELVDTPGVGSAIEINTATTRWFLPRADAVIFVTGFDSPLTEAEVGFLTGAARHAGRLFLVLNKRDLVSVSEAAAVTEFVRGQLRDGLGLDEPRLFGLSALEALEAAARGDDERLAGSGLAPLHAALSGFLATGKTLLFLRNVAEGGAALVAELRRDLRLGRLALEGGPDPSTVLTAFGLRMAELDLQRRRAADTIASRVESGLPGLLAARSAEWQASLHELLDPSVEYAIGADTGAAARDRLEIIQSRLEETGRGLAADWLERRTGEVLELLTGLVADQVSVLLDVARSPGPAAAEIAGLTSGDGPAASGGWTADDLPGLVVRPPQWTVRMSLPRRFRPPPDGGDAGRPRVTDALRSAISAFEAGARAGFAQAAQDWVSRLDRQAAQQAQEAAAHVRRCLRAAPTDEDLAALDNLAARLTAFQAFLGSADTSPDPAAARSPAPAAGSRAGAGGCVVCEQMEATLTEQLRRGQFRLATLEPDQARHARAGGYCPLHTWQYAAIASPLGISAGYAKLAGMVADALESIGREDGTAAELASRVAALSPGTATCSLCGSVAGRERQMITEITSGVTRPTVLCLRHLALALAARPAPEAGRALVRALAEALQRNADDMRVYALKREARHQGLLSQEESDAYLDALRRLVGLPTLSRP